MKCGKLNPRPLLQRTKLRSRSHQKEMPTPGQNQKRYLAGAQDVRTGELIYVVGTRKNTMLFVFMLWELMRRYPNARNSRGSRQLLHSDDAAYRVMSAYARGARRLVLHFLPPYCPDHNRIERTWQDLDANVSRSHKCRTIKDLMHNVRSYIRTHNSGKFGRYLSC